MDNLPSPFVSVIIPVFNDVERLKTCLRSLENQTYPGNLYEVIIVDNGSDEDIETVVGQFDQAIATYESHPGSYAARNKGITLAKGDAIAFTDSDCIPASDWIEKGIESLLHTPNCGLVAGRIELFFKDPEQPTAVELYDSIIFLQQKKFVEIDKFGATANIFTFKSIFDSVGFFNDKLKSNGDKDWGQRVFSCGYELTYANDTVVHHPARYSFDQLYKKIARVVGGNHDLHGKNNFSFIRFIQDLASLLRPPLRSIFREFWPDKRLKGTKQKIKFIIAVEIAHYIETWERVRLQLGGKSTRG